MTRLKEFNLPILGHIHFIKVVYIENNKLFTTPP